MKNPSASKVRVLSRYQRFLVAALSTLTLFPLSACQKTDAKAAAAPPVQPPRGSGKSDAAQGRPSTPVQKPRASEPPPPDLFKRGRAVKFELSSDLLRPFPEEFSRAALKSQKITLVSFEPKKNLWLAVDHHAPRRARSAQVAIFDLLSEDVELAPGSHILTAFEWGAAEQGRLQVRHFFVEVGPASLPRTPGCLLVTPELTKNGSEASKELRFLAVPLALGLDRVEYFAEGEGVKSRGEAPPGTEIILEGPPAGDIKLSVRCYSGDEQVAGDEQMVTVNPDVREPESVP